MADAVEVQPLEPLGSAGSLGRAIPAAATRRMMVWNVADNSRGNTVGFDPDAAWTKTNALWKRFAQLTCGSIEFLQVRIAGAIGRNGWVVDDSCFESYEQTATKMDEAKAGTPWRRRHVRIYEEENGVVNVFDPVVTGGPSAVSDASQIGVPSTSTHSFSSESHALAKEWSELESTMYGEEADVNLESDPPLWTNVTSLIAHPTLYFTTTSPNLSHLRQESHSLHLRSLPATTLVSLHIAQPSLLHRKDARLTHLRNLQHLAIGTGNWSPALFAGGSSRLGSFDLTAGGGTNRGGLHGMRGEYLPEVEHRSDEGNGVVFASLNVRRLLMSISGRTHTSGRAILRSLAVGEVDLETVKLFVLGKRGFQEKRTHINRFSDPRSGSIDHQGIDHSTSNTEVDSEMQQSENSDVDVPESPDTDGVGEDDLLLQALLLSPRGQGSALAPSSPQLVRESPFSRVANILHSSSLPPTPASHNQRKEKPNAPPRFQRLRNLWLRIVPTRPGLEFIGSVVDRCPTLECIDITYSGATTSVQDFVQFAKKLAIWKNGDQLQQDRCETEEPRLATVSNESQGIPIVAPQVPLRNQQWHNRLAVNLWVTHGVFSRLNLPSLEKEIHANTVRENGSG
ncbi:hypothetical protein HDU84_007497, partial [Entophlyctis sp. JEL0112]